MGKGDVKRGRGSLALAILSTIIVFSTSAAFAGWTGLIPPAVSLDWSLSKMSFSSPADGWAVGEDSLNRTGVLLQYSNGSWKTVSPPNISSHWALSDVHFPASGKGWAVGTDFNGGKGVLLHFTGGMWTGVPTPTVSPDWSLSGVHFPSTSAGWMVGKDANESKGVIIGYLDDTLTLISPPAVSSDWDLRGVYFPSATEGWAVGRDTASARGVLLHYIDGLWQNEIPPAVSSDWDLRGVCFPSATEGWAVGRDTAHRRGVLLHYTGGLWQIAASPEVSGDWELNGVHFTSRSTGWAVGTDMFNKRGVLLQFANGVWTVVSPPGISPDWGLWGVDLVSPYQGIALGWDRTNRAGVLLQYFLPPPEIIVTPNVLNFQNVMLGGVSEQEIVVKNIGFSALVLFSIADETEPPFSRVGGDCGGGTVLSPGQECTMIFQFAPTSVGTFSSEITIFSNDPSESEFVIPIGGGSGPDLFGQWKKFSQDCKTRRGEIRCGIIAVFEVRNIGNAQASSSLVRFYFSNDSKLDEEKDLFLGRAKINRLKPAQEKDVKLKFKLDHGETPTGKYLFAVVDAKDDVVEADETNNIALFGRIP